ncbi:DUF2188 domain-containing protein [Pseudomonas sp. ADAK13]|uniref:DUF2188 domain-containing protein n=1 Tax=Pseudomonas sp. ADAK13 TaxID=2730847 RepID=UPI0014633877|nr:DUF2188 domain-containing protein [Pseudomonas sp. ADAK13]
MVTYRIEKTSKGWALFRARRFRPVAETETKEELIKVAAQILAGSKVAVRVHNANGTFQELRL